MATEIRPVFDFRQIDKDTLNTALGAVRSIFPVTGPKRSMKLNNLWVGEVPQEDDFAKMKDVLYAGKTWEYPIFASLTLVDNASGKTIDTTRQLKLMGVPRYSPLYGYLVDGSWRYVQNQLRLKSGAYSVVTKDGGYQTQVMTEKGHNYKLDLDPQTSVFTLTPSTSSSAIKLLPLLTELGMGSSEIQSAWGDKVFAANQAVMKKAETPRLYKALFSVPPRDPEKTVQEIHNYFRDKTKISPDTTQRTLGTSFETVSPQLFLAASKRLLSMAKGDSAPDDRQSLANKELHSVTTFLREYIEGSKEKIRTHILRQIEKRDTVRESISPLHFNQPVKSFFSNSSMSTVIKQTNPVQNIGEQYKITLMGEGGITTDRAVTEEIRQVHGSHAGLIDPLHTPEGGAIGTTLSVAMGNLSKGNDLAQQLIRLKTGKLEHVTAQKASESTVAFPGEFLKEGNTWKPRAALVRALVRSKDSLIDSREVDYMIPDPRALFTVASNLIPFLNSVNGARSMMGSKHIEQALPLKNPEAPWVQTQATPKLSFERLVGADSATLSRVAGKVTQITDDHIVVKTPKGDQKHGLFNYLPLNEKTYFHSTPRVKVGDNVQPGQLLADSNYTAGSTLAIGRNVTVAYTPWKEGHSFEDGVVISEDLAKKLTSIHMYRMPIKGGDNVTLDSKAFLARYPSAFTATQTAKIGPDGLIKKGERVVNGDPLALRLVKEELAPEDKLLAQLRRGFMQPEKNRSVLWEEDFEGEILDVRPSGNDWVVTVRTEEQARVGDKTSVRHGGKGIISKILPVSEMPHTVAGKPIEMLLNPQGVMSRMNIGQTFENLAGKVAEKVGKPVYVDNFAPGHQGKKVLALAKLHGVSDKEDLVDPSTGFRIPQVAVGSNYIYKLNHPVRSKFAARSLGPYNDDLTPTKGDAQGGISLDMLTSYGLLAHGSKSILREAALKGQANPEWWRSYRLGQTRPLPKTTEVFSRFTNLLKATGINVERRGGEMLLMPILDKDVDKFSNGEIQKPLQLAAKNLSPEKYGLFDQAITGGLRGDKWSHFTLAEPMPHPVFEGPIRAITGLTGTQFDSLMASKSFVDPKTNQIGASGTLTAGRAIQHLLKQVDPTQRLQDLLTKLPSLKGPDLDKANKQVRYLQALQTTGKKPEDYVVTKIPVLPPRMRPVYPGENGELRHNEVNYLYRDAMLVNQGLKGLAGLPESEKSRQRKDLYDAVKALAGVGSKPVLSQGEERKGILTNIAGVPQPKFGYFQNKLLKRRQDLTGKSTIINAPEMGIDEVGIPEDMAWQIFRERGIRDLVSRGRTILQAQELWEKREPLARTVLETVMKDQPVLLNRAPSLHKFSIMAFNPILRKDKTLGLHPLVMKGFNADVDGDNMFVHVPVLPSSINEAKKMMPSNNLFNPRDNSLLVMPDQEAIQGLFLLSKTPNGRKLINALLPPALQDNARIWTKPVAGEVLSKLARQHSSEFPTIVNKLKDLGNSHAYYLGITLGTSDLVVSKAPYDSIFRQAETAAAKIRGNKSLNEAAKDKAYISAYRIADQKVMAEQRRSYIGSGSQIGNAMESGAKAKPDQIKQMTAAPVLFDSGTGKSIPLLIKSNLAEGMPPADYWASLYGARKGMIDKGLSTAKPGELTKAVINALGKYVITTKDCGTKKGAPVNLLSKPEALSAVGHILAQTAGGFAPGTTITHAHLQKFQTDHVTTIQIRTPLVCEAAQGVCSMCYGIQQEKSSFPAIGENVGALAAHSIGEPSTQAILKSFHTAGVASAAQTAGVTNMFERIDQILNVPKTLPHSATLAQVDGTVGTPTKAPAGGWYVLVGTTQHYVKPGLEPVVKSGSTVKKGTPLSTGVINPHDLLLLRGSDVTRQFLSRELHDTYNTGGTSLRKVHTDLAARAMTNYAKVLHPGDHTGYLAGDIAPSSQVMGFQAGSKALAVPLTMSVGRRLAADTPEGKKGALVDVSMANRLRARGIQTVLVEAQGPTLQHILTSVTQAPLKSTDWLSRLGSTNLKTTLLEGAAQMWRTNIHGADPIPALAVGTEIGEGTDLY